MKKVCFLICVLLATISCQNQESINLASSPETVKTALLFPAGLRISQFDEEGKSMTSSVSEFFFVFLQDGTVTATRTDEVIVGNYFVFSDDGITELRLGFPKNSPLSELDDDWYFISNDSSSIRFEDNEDVLEFQFL